MRIDTLQLENFRGLRQVELAFPGQMTLLVGVNGVGKSAVLDALAILLSAFVSRLQGNANKARKFSPDDIQVGQAGLRASLQASIAEQTLGWSMALNQRASRDAGYKSELEALNELTKPWAEQIAGDQVQFNLPVAVHYGVQRAVVDTPLRVRDRHLYAQLDAYDEALENTATDFHAFFKWFSQREDLENEQIRDHAGYRDPQLVPVRRAIEQFMTGFSDLRVRRNPMRLTVKKAQVEFNLQQLSDGEKCLLALVADLAQRLTLANPGLADPLEGSGVVLIDEVDLHLHPRLQREVVSKLTGIFPNCQFIVSTHSPQILSHVPDDSVWLLRRDETSAEIVCSRPPVSTFGLDSNSVLELIMDVPEREPHVKARLRELFVLVDGGQLADAKALIDEIEQGSGELGELVRAKALIRRKELIGR